MKKKTKVNKKKLDSLLLVLLLTAVLMVMSTYAWFTANRTVNISELNVRIETKSGLQISADAEEWGTVLNVEKLQAATRKDNPNIKNQLPTSMEPVSTKLEIDEANSRLKMYLGTTEEVEGKEGKFTLTSTLEDEISYTPDAVEGTPTGNFLAFDIYLKSGNAEPNFYMFGDIFEHDGSGKSGKKSLDDERGITNAVRVAIIRGDNTTDIPSTPEGCQALRNNLRTTKNVLLWEPNANYHTEAAVDNASKVGITTSLSAGATTPGSRLPYYGLKKTFDNMPLEESNDVTTHGDSIEMVTPTWNTDKNEVRDLRMPTVAKTADGKDVALEAGITKYRIYMWVEGQDVDCENVASGSDIQFNLGFSLDNNNKPAIEMNPVTP